MTILAGAGAPRPVARKYSDRARYPEKQVTNLNNDLAAGKLPSPDRLAGRS